MGMLDDLARAEGFTDTERMLAQFMLDCASEVTQMSIHELAGRTFTSNATIVRFCRKLGVSGYREFRVRFAAELEKSRLASSEVDADRPFGKGEAADLVMSRIAALSKEAVDAAYASSSPDDLERAARIIREAPCTYVFATGDSRISAIAFGNMLVKLGIRLIIADEYGDAAANARAMRPEDAVLAISYSGRLMDDPVMREVAGALLQRGCRSVWISSAKGPAGFDVELRFPARETDAGKMATFYSQTCIRYLLNSLYGIIYSLDY